jgi:hypothetical protein
MGGQQSGVGPGRQTVETRDIIHHHYPEGEIKDESDDDDDDYVKKE